MDMLDSEFADLIHAVEQRFGTGIPAADAMGLATPQALVDYLAAHLPAVASASCGTQAAFYRVRAALLADGDLPRDRVRPDTPMDELLSRARRRERWRALGERLAIAAWPPLRRTDAQERFVAYSGVAIGSAVLFGGLPVGVNPVALLVAGFVLGFATAALVARYLTTRATGIPWGYPCVADLARHVAAQSASGPWTRDQIVAGVADILAGRFNVRGWHPTATFAGDLGFD